MTDQYVTCRHCGIGINYQCDCDDDAAEERGREEVWGKVLDTLRTVYGRDMPYNESPCELIADLVPPGDVAALREAAEAVAAFDSSMRAPVLVRGVRALNCVDALRALLAEQGAGGAIPHEVAELLRGAVRHLEDNGPCECRVDGPVECGWCRWHARAESALARYGSAPLAPPPAPEAKKRIAELEALLRECNAVCLCGCPEAEHDGYGEDGESCGHDDHECIRVAPAVLEIVQRYRVALSDALKSAPSDAAVRQAAERLWRSLTPPRSTTDDGMLLVRAEDVEAVLRALSPVPAAPAKDEVREAAEALLRYHDACGMESSYGDALRAALAKRGGE